MAKALKARRIKELKKHSIADDTEEEEAIKELESQGDLKKDVPVGGEEFEDEEPRQGG